jgi:myo-inositol-1(or 4)-monophosphatase
VSIENAMAFALKAHQGQKRKGSQTPYIFHLVETAQIVLQEKGHKETVIAALLHDVLEDTDVKMTELKDLFSSRVCQLVGQETENKSLSWDDRKEATIRETQNTTDQQLKLLVLADKLSNLRSMERDLSECGVGFWDRFNQKDPKRHEWYYREIGKAFVSLADTRSYQEYLQLLERVFGGAVTGKRPAYR